MKIFIILYILKLLNTYRLWKDLSSLLYVNMYTDNSIYPNRRCIAIILTNKIAIVPSKCFEDENISEIKVFEYFESSNCYEPAFNDPHTHNLFMSMDRTYYIDKVRFKEYYYTVKIHPNAIIISHPTLISDDKDSESNIYYIYYLFSCIN